MFTNFERDDRKMTLEMKYLEHCAMLFNQVLYDYHFLYKCVITLLDNHGVTILVI